MTSPTKEAETFLEAMVADIDNLTDEELAAEFKDTGRDIAQVAAHVRRVLADSVADFQRSRRKALEDGPRTTPSRDRAMNLQDALNEYMETTCRWEQADLGQDMVNFLEREIPGFQDRHLPTLTPDQESELAQRLLAVTATYLDEQGLDPESLQSRHRAACKRAVRQGAAAYHRGAALRESPYTTVNEESAELLACWRNGYEEASLNDHADSGVEDAL